MRINTNMNAMTALNQMGKNTALAGSSMNKISSGERINKAGDDAAGMAISEKMRSQIRGLDQAGRNTQDGISVVQTAEGAMEEIGNITQRMRELSIQAANETNSVEDREKITTELTQLHKEIDRIADSTEFNGKTLLKGTEEVGGADGVTRAAGNANVTSDIATGFATVSSTGQFAGKDTMDATIAVNTTGGSEKVEMTLDGETVVGTLGADKKTITFEFASGDAISVELDTAITDIATDIATLSGGLDGKKVTIAEANDGGTTPPTEAGDRGKLDLVIQAGANTGNGQTITIEIDNVTTAGLGLDEADIAALNNTNLAEGTKAANDLTDKLDAALESINTSRAKLGAQQNRLESAQSNLTTSNENLTAAESRIRDVDVAKEMMNLSKLNLLSQASQAMAGQAKQQPEGVMQLLR